MRASPNAPRPTGRALEIADGLRRIENNYAREGSGPGSRFEGRLLEDVQAEWVVRELRCHRLHAHKYDAGSDETLREITR